MWLIKYAVVFLIQYLPFNAALVYDLIIDETYPETDYLKKSVYGFVF